MVSILEEILRIFDDGLEDELVSKALCFERNQGLAVLGDAVLDLVICEFTGPVFDPEEINRVRQGYAKREDHRKMINGDELKQVIIESDYQQPSKNIGLKRADRYVEALIGAVYLKSRDIDEVMRFVYSIYQFT